MVAVWFKAMSLLLAKLQPGFGFQGSGFGGHSVTRLSEFRRLEVMNAEG
jgi:hypothetical protein